ncbi:uncharacterized protein LOC113325851 [Papaver somniferum]|uniref:uncharacterized protein LOC113325851 n=1 Tax=Papaver somniferum TaxID=3469 RepID=UPI000E7011C9|nr:uncharacterized protein LOC113325851 [Papaver somniferum]
MTVLEELFDQPIVVEIMNITIHINQEDMLICLLEKNGKFTVKPCYRRMFADKQLNVSVGPRMQKIHKTLWKLPILPRIRQFIWKCISELLSTRDVLCSSITGQDKSCPFCEQHLETSTHVIINCSLSRAVWFSTLGSTANNLNNLSDWVCNWFDDFHGKLINDQILIIRCIVAWCIWNERCDKLFQNSQSTPEKIARRSSLYIEEHAKQISPITNELHRVNRSNIHWIPPP